MLSCLWLVSEDAVKGSVLYGVFPYFLGDQELSVGKHPCVVEEAARLKLDARAKLS